MKKNFFPIMFFIFSVFAFGTEKTNINSNSLQPWQQELSIGNPAYEEYYKSIKILMLYDGKLSLSRYWYTDKDIKGMGASVQGQINYLSDITLNKNGFLSFSFDNKDYYFIPHHTETIMFPVGFLPNSNDIEKQKNDAKKFRLYPEIHNAKASSFLTEKTKKGICEYSPEYIEDYFPQHGIILPWVEGAEGYGISEYLEFDVRNGTELNILNGYVDPAHPELFKNNGRIKKAKFEVLFEDGNETIKDIEFMDFVYCKQIQFYKRIKHVKIIIEEVYPGKKYEDTCISRIFTDFSYSL